MGRGCRGLRVRTVTPPSPAMASAPAVEVFPDTPSAEPEALARKQRLVLDKAYRYLLDQGFGVLELASLDLDEVSAMARQLAEELAIPLGGWLEDALYCWLQEAQQEAKIHRRVRGYLQDDLTWMTRRRWKGGGPVVPRPGSGYSHVRRATARSADAG